MPASSGARNGVGTQRLDDDHDHDHVHAYARARAQDLPTERRADRPADWIWEEPHLPSAELGRALAEANGFLFDALPANRAGRLTTEQLDRLRRSQRPKDPRLAVLGGLALLAGLLVLVWGGVTGPTAVAGWAAVIGGLLLLRRGLLRPAAADLALDLAPRQVAVVEAEVAKGCFRRGSQRRARRRTVSPAADTFYLIDGQAVEVTAAGYAALEAGRRYRVYYVRQSSGRCRLINLEPSDLDPAPVPRPSSPPNWQALLGYWRLTGIRARDGSWATMAPVPRLRECEFRPDGSVALITGIPVGPGGSDERRVARARYLWLDEACLRLVTELQTRDLTVDLRGDRLVLSTGSLSLDFVRVDAAP